MGKSPRTAPQQLRPEQAQIADNCDLYAGELRPMPRTASVGKLVNTPLVKSIYTYQDKWLGFSEEADFVQGPLHDDHEKRVYCTFDSRSPSMFKIDGLGVDEFQNATIDLRGLGVPTPVATPVVAVVGGTGDVKESRTYVFTHVTDLGEEGDISPASNVIDVKADSSVSVTGVAIPPSDSHVTKKRIYRSNTGSSATAFQFVAEINADIETYSDSIKSDALGETLETEGFVPPPANMQGLIALPSGLMAGFTGKTLCFCEPYKPYAWPERYQLTTNYDIVGLGHIGSTLVVMTSALVYLVSCADPETASMDSYDDIVPCVSKRGIVCSRWGVIFPSTQGLVGVTLSGIELATRDLFTRREWEAMKPETIHGYVHADKYIGFYKLDSGGKGFIFDPVEPTARLVDISTYATAGYIKPEDDLCLAIQSGADHIILSWAQNEFTPHILQWRSKDFRSPYPLNFAAAKVLCDPPDILTAEEWAEQRADIIAKYDQEIADGDIGGYFNDGLLGEYAINGNKFDIIALTYSPPTPTTFRLYGDGVLRHVCKVVDPYPFRLPGGYTAQSWELEVVGSLSVKEIHIATSVSEIN